MATFIATGLGVLAPRVAHADESIARESIAKPDPPREAHSAARTFARVELGPSFLLGHRVNDWEDASTSEYWVHGLGGTLDIAAGLQTSDRLAFGLNIAFSGAPRLAGGTSAVPIKHQFSFVTTLGAFADVGLTRPRPRSVLNLELGLSAAIYQQGAGLNEVSESEAVFFGPSALLGLRYEFANVGACSLGVSGRSTFAYTQRVDRTELFIIPTLAFAGVCR